MALVRSIPLWLVLLAVLMGAWLGLAPASAVAGPPELAKAKGEACIRDKEWMRHNHMDYLKQRREETVRLGMRDRRDSLLNCQSCHPNRSEFCDRCHSYVGVEPDCFECHNYPE